MTAFLDLVLRLEGGEEVLPLVDALNEGLEGVDESAASTEGGFSVMKAAGVGAITAIGAVAVGLGAAVAGGISAVAGLATDTNAAINNLQVDLGLTREEAEELGEVAKDVWSNNFAGSIEEASEAVGLARQQLGLMGEDLQDATENALRLSDAYDIDISESLDAAAVLSERFGLSQQEAFDLISSGIQDGLNVNDDFLDSIREYSGLFAETGFSAEQMYSIMNTGAQAGILGVDKVSDAVKEMNIRLGEGGDDVEAAFDAIGLSFDDIAGFVASGDENWADYFDNIVQGLAGIEDPMERQAAQTAIFGTMAEDLGLSFTDGLSSAQTALEDMSGATDILDAQYNDLPSTIEGFKRTVLTALMPVSDVIVDLAQVALPMIGEAAGRIAGIITPIIEDIAAGFQGFFSNLEGGMSIWDALIDSILTWTQFGESNAEMILEWVTILETRFWPQVVAAKDAILEFIAPIIEAASQFVRWQDIAMVLAAVLGGVVLSAIISIGATLLPIIGVIAAVVAAIALLRAAWETDFGGIRTFIEENIPRIQEIITTALENIRIFWEENGEAIIEFVTNFWDLLVLLFETQLEFILGVVEAFILLFQGDWEGFLETLEKTFRELWENIIEFLKGLWDLLKPVLESIWNSIVTFWESIDWKSLGQSVIDGIVGGISAGAGAIAEAAKSAASAALDAAKELLGISSPSKAFMELGVNSAEGFAMGLSNSGSLIARAVESSIAIPQTINNSENQSVTLINPSFNEVSSSGDMFRELRNLS